MSDADRRAYLRYRVPEGGTVTLLIADGESERPIIGLLMNESHQGLACVYVGPALEIEEEVIWQEAEILRTPCEVIRCEELYRDVYLLGLQITG